MPYVSVVHAAIVTIAIGHQLSFCHVLSGIMCQSVMRLSVVNAFVLTITISYPL